MVIIPQKKCAVCTSSRSEYGLMRQLISLLAKQFDTYLLVGGSHFSGGVHASFQEIEQDHLLPSDHVIKIDFDLTGNDAFAQVNALGAGTTNCGKYLAEHEFDVAIVLGDRWELFGFSLPMLLNGVVVCHISGGELTEGVIDDSIRHAHTKLAHLHFVANIAYAERVSRMGEEDWRITVSGECGLDSIYKQDIAKEQEILDLFGIDLKKPTLLVTYHPSTFEAIPVAQQITAVLKACNKFSQYQIVFTGPAAEQGSDEIVQAIQSYCTNNANCMFVPHLGSRNYLRIIKTVKAVIGNSSSGIVEAPSLGTPTVNIGNRQKNRLAADSVVHVPCSPAEIEAGIASVLKVEVQALAKQVVNPYDPWHDGRNAERIVIALVNALRVYPRQQLLCKRFDQEINRSQWNQLIKDFT